MNIIGYRNKIENLTISSNAIVEITAIAPERTKAPVLVKGFISKKTKPDSAKTIINEITLIRNIRKLSNTTGQKKLFLFFQAFWIEGLRFSNMSLIISNLITATPTPTTKVITKNEITDTITLFKFSKTKILKASTTAASASAPLAIDVIKEDKSAAPV